MDAGLPDAATSHDERDATLVTDDAGRNDAGTADRARHGACDDDRACGANGHCLAVVAGGYRTCLYPLPAPQECTGGTPFEDECCGTCDGGVCALHTSCGGAFQNPHNVCVAQGCASDAECGTRGVCLPAADGGVRQCLTQNECRVNADCTAATGGACVVTGRIGPSSTCEPYACGGDPRTFGPLRCYYADQCASDTDCDAGHCEPSASTRPHCAPGPRPMCPPPP